MTETSRSAPVRMAMVGGGAGSFIGPVHRMAAGLDRRIDLVAGAFSSDPARSLEAGRALGLAGDRIHADWRAMIAAEAGRPDGAELVAIVTPNHLHLPVALAAIDAGLHVVSDKPATATLAEALALRDALAATDRVYALTYTYTGYPMIRRARALVAEGALGEVRRIVVDYPQGWLAEAVETGGNKQAAWRADPAQAGVGGCIGDIGVHAFNLAEYVGGVRVSEFVADLGSVVPGRRLDDDVAMLLRFDNGARGVLLASQVATGERNTLTIRVQGTKAGLTWSHATPAILTIDGLDGETRILHGGGEAGARLPVGHPEGFIEAFANIYRDVAAAVRGADGIIDGVVPGIVAGVRSMRFVHRAVESSAARAGWTSLEGGDL